MSISSTEQSFEPGGEVRRRVDELETILEILPIGVAVSSDPSCSVIQVNPAFADVLGISTEQETVVGRGGTPTPIYRDVHNGAEISESELPLRRAATTGEEMEIEIEVELADGRTRTLWQSARPLLDAEGHVRGSVCVASDITEQKREVFDNQFLSRTSEILASTRELQTMVDALTREIVPVLADACVVDLVDDTGGPVHASMRAQTRDGVDATWQLQEGPAIADLPDHPVHDVLRTGISFIANGKSGPVAEQISHNPQYLATLRAVGVTSVLVVPLQARGRVLGAVSMGTVKGRRRFDRKDVKLATELARRVALAIDNVRLLESAERAREDAQRANRAKSDFLATMSHELRTPLNAIAGYTQLLQLGLRGELTQGQRDDLDRIAHNQRHLLGLINSVLNFAKLDAGSMHYHITDVDIQDLLESVEPMIGPQMRTNGLQYRHDSCTNALSVRADEDKLRQILLNLLSNAIKFTPMGGTVSVNCFDDDMHGYIAVTDTGVGIPASKLERIFEPFMQVDRTLSTTHEGVGLGLAICRDLAHGMGGDIVAQSGVAQGTTFTLSLPKV
jgi:PAS domain S-box-containing protein